MNNFGLCFLAYGNEHIEEFNILSSDLLLHNPNLNIYVVTNDKLKIINQNLTVIETKEDFNFNLKRLAIEEAFKYHSTIVLLDTDLKILNKSFSFMSNIVGDGMYVKWIDKELTHKAERLNIRNNEYCVELSKLNYRNQPIQFIPEYCVYLKITDQVKQKEFIHYWEKYHNKVKDLEPTDRHNDLNGAVEGCIMYLTCLNLNISIVQGKSELFTPVTHYGSEQFKTSLI